MTRTVIDVANERLVGTYGTGPQGETTDERACAFDISGYWEQQLEFLNSGTHYWATIDQEHSYFDGERIVSFGAGWVCATPIRVSSGMVRVRQNRWIKIRAVGITAFQKQNVTTGVGAQTIGEDCACGTASDNQYIEGAIRAGVGCHDYCLQFKTFV